MSGEPAASVLGLLGLLGLYMAMSAATYLAYAADKSAARNGRRRTPERTLHLLALAGGWPGALLAQRVHRHKTKKTSFLTMYWLTVALNCAALGWFIRSAT